MNDRAKEIKLVLKMAELTRQGKLSWHRERPPNVTRAGGEQFIDGVYLTQVNNMILRVAQVRRPTLNDQPTSKRLGNIFGGNLLLDDAEWVDELALEVVDNDGRVIRRLGGDLDVQGLWDAILETQVDLDELMDNLVKLA